MSITYFGPVRVDGLPLAALDIVSDAADAKAYVEETQFAPPADPACDDEQAAVEAAIAREVWSRV
jgi:hypothetical protein